jgi:hypothetical protein
LTAGTGQAASFRAGLGKLQQLAQGGGSGAVQGGAHRPLGRFQIETPGLPPLLKNHPQELTYRARDLLPDRFRRFFSCAFGLSSSTGRKRQIAVLVSTNWRLSSWNLRNSATSRSALRRAAGVGRDSEMVFPSAL